MDRSNQKKAQERLEMLSRTVVKKKPSAYANVITRDSPVIKRVEALVKQYTRDLPSCATVRQRKHTPLPNQHTILMTGATGDLGQNILEQLLLDPQVAHLYCLVRRDNAGAAVTSTLEARNSTLNFAKVTFLKGTISSPDLGLEPAEFTKLQRSVTCLIHNAWEVNFNKQLPAFEDIYIPSVRHMVDFCLNSHFNTHLFFTSSIGAMMNWFSTGRSGPVPECVHPDPLLGAPGGYGMSKWIGEMILDAAARRSGIPCTFFRVAQIGGSTTPEGTRWTPLGAMPRMVKTSLAFGALPDRCISFERINWTPIDVAARTYCDVVKSRLAEPLPEPTPKSPLPEPVVAHICLRHWTPWSFFLRVCQSYFQEHNGRDVSIITYNEWIDRLKEIKFTEGNMQRFPALALLDFFMIGRRGGRNGEFELSTELTKERSPSLKNYPELGEREMRIWLGQWDFRDQDDGIKPEESQR